jgi:glutaredoxin
VLYGRAGCCLCEEAREVLTRVRARWPFDLSECDIDSDEELQRAYLERIPVVTINGIEAFELLVDEAQLERWLAAPDAPEAAPDAPLPASRVQPG